MKNQKIIASILTAIVFSFGFVFNINAADGDVDSSFVSRLFGGIQPGTGLDASTAQSIALQPDGKMLVGGTFKSFANRLQNGIARLNADGTPDYAFYPVVNGVSSHNRGESPTEFIATVLQIGGRRFACSEPCA